MRIFDQEFEVVREGRYLCLECRTEFSRADAVRHLVGRICPDAPIPVRVTLTGQIYARAIRLAVAAHQVVGEKNNYYVTLEQLENILQSFSPFQRCTPSTPPRSSPDRP